MKSHSFYEKGHNLSSSVSSVIEKSLLKDENNLKQLQNSFNKTKEIFVAQQKVHEQSLIEIQALLSKATELSSVVSGVKNALLSDSMKNVSFAKLKSNYSKRLHNLSDFVAAHKLSVAPSSQASSSQLSAYSSVMGPSDSVRLTESLRTSSNPAEVVLEEVVAMSGKTRTRMMTVAKLREDIEKLRRLYSQSKQAKPGKYSFTDELGYDEDAQEVYTQDNNNDDEDNNNNTFDDPYGTRASAGAGILRTNASAMVVSGSGASSLSRVRQRRSNRRALWGAAVTSLSQRTGEQQTSQPPSTSAVVRAWSGQVADARPSSVAISTPHAPTRASSVQALVSPGAIVVKNTSELRSWLHVERCVTVDAALPDTPDAVSRALQPPRSEWETFHSPLRDAASMPLPKLTFLPPTSPPPKSNMSNAQASTNISDGRSASAFASTAGGGSSGLSFSVNMAHFAGRTDTGTGAVSAKSPAKPIIRKPSPSRAAADRANSVGSDGGLFLSGEGGLDDEAPRSRKHSVSGDPVPSSPSYSVPSSPSPHDTPAVKAPSPNAVTKAQLIDELCTILQRFYDQEPDLEIRKSAAEIREFVVKEGTKTLKLLTNRYKDKFTKYVPEKFANSGANVTITSPSVSATTANATGSFGASKVTGGGIAVDQAKTTGMETNKPALGASTTPSIASQVEKIIREIYEVHSKDRVPKVPHLMEKYAGNEVKLLRSVEEKYKVPPATLIYPDQTSKPATTAAASMASNNGIGISGGGSEKSLFGAKPSQSLFSAVKSGTSSLGAESPSVFSTPGRDANASTLFQPKPQAAQPQTPSQAPLFGSSASGGSLFGASKPGSPANSLFGSAPQATGSFSATPNTSAAVFGQPVPSGMVGLLAQGSGLTSMSSGGGIQPTPPGTQLSVQEITMRLRNIYTKYEPAKVDKIPVFLKKYAGREMALLEDVEKKYLSGAAGVASVDSSQSTPSSSLFGGRLGSAATVGSNATSNASTGLFGANAGAGGAGLPPRQSTLFGAVTGQNFSGTSSMTGSTSPAPASVWGAPSRNASSALFGSTSQSHSGGIGSAGPNASGLFGQQTSSPSGGGFGTRSGSLFGNSPQSSQQPHMQQHMQQQQQPTSTLFGGQSPGAGGSLFGSQPQTQAPASAWGTYRQ